MDIEGGEYNALLGAKKTLKFVKNLVIEISDNVDEVHQLLHSEGFNYVSCDDHPLDDTLPSGNVFFYKQLR